MLKDELQFMVGNKIIDCPNHCLIFFTADLDPIAAMITGDETSPLGREEMAEFFRQDATEMVFIIEDPVIKSDHRVFTRIMIVDCFNRRFKIP